MTKLWHALMAGLRRLFRRGAADRDLDDELRHYEEEAAQAYVDSGIPIDEAARAARVEVGSRAALTQQVRSNAWESSIESVWGDLRHGVRVLARARAFTFTAIAVLGLGIGANTAIFSIVNAVLLRPPSVEKPDELVYIYPALPGGSSIYEDEVESYRGEKELFVDIASFGSASASIIVNGYPAAIRGETVSANYFEVLGVRPRIGRAFGPAENSAAAPPVVIISDRLWRQHFNAAPDIIGRTVSLQTTGALEADDRYTVIGVMAPAFTGLVSPWVSTEFWTLSRQFRRTTMATASAVFGGAPRKVATAVGRRRAGVALSQLQALVDTRHAQFVQADPMMKRTFSANQWLTVLDSRRVRLPLDDAGKIAPERLGAALLLMAGLVLIIGVVNMVGLTVARGVVRTPEIAVRLTLGASRARLASQLTIEGLLLAAAGGLAGVAASRWMVDTFVAGLPAVVGSSDGLWPNTMQVPVDVTVLTFTMFLVLVAGLTIGLAPVRQAWKTDLLSTLNSASVLAPRHVRSRLRHWIVAPQVCLCMGLVLAAGVAIRSLLSVALVDPGFKPAGVAFVSPQLPIDTSILLLPEAARKAASAARGERDRRFKRNLVEMARQKPGVVAVALASSVPSGGNATFAITREDFVEERAYHATFSTVVTPGYFDAVGLPILAGRALTEADVTTWPHGAVVDETLAARIWPGQSAIGQQFALKHPASVSPVTWLEVVGVARGVRAPLSTGEVKPFVYLPPTGDGAFIAATLFARGAGDDVALVATLRAVVREADPGAHISRAQTLTQWLHSARYPRRLAVALIVPAAFTGLLLAGLGLYGVVSYSVSQRVRELGIRAALGAGRADLIALVMRDGALVAVVGALIGIVLAYFGVQIYSSRVFATPPLDVVMLVTATLSLAVVVLLACYLPARRAVRVDPVTALRWL